MMDSLVKLDASNEQKYASFHHKRNFALNKLIAKIRQHKAPGQLRFYVALVVAIVATVGMAENAFAAHFIQKGASGAEVNTIQSRLQKLGYLNHQPTGFFGSLTEKAVKNFQRKKGLTPDGIIGPRTKAILFKTNESRPQVSRRDRNSRQVARLPVPALAPIGNIHRRTAQRSSTGKSYLFSAQILRRGYRNGGVKLLQQELRNRGFYQGPLDGIYGMRTETAVRKFQQANNLTPDGVAGKRTLAMLTR